MHKKCVVLLAGLALAPVLLSQDKPTNESCMQECLLERPNLELQRQEVVALEKEAARAVQHNDGTFFRRVYSDDFIGTLSHGQAVNKTAFIQVVEAGDVQYESVSTSDINVRLYRDTAVATSLWSLRTLSKGQRSSSQVRMIHVYLASPRGYRLVASQASLLPPFGQLPL